MPTLNWIGKEKVVNHHLDVPVCTLEKKYTYGEGDDGNMIIHGDNLYALKALLPKYEGRIKCIYIDPADLIGQKRKWPILDKILQIKPNNGTQSTCSERKSVKTSAFLLSLES